MAFFSSSEPAERLADWTFGIKWGQEIPGPHKAISFVDIDWTAHICY